MKKTIKDAKPKSDKAAQKSPKSKNGDDVCGFSCLLVSLDGCQQEQNFYVTPKKKKIKSVWPNPPWDPSAPHQSIETVQIDVLYKSGRRLSFDLHGEEFVSICGKSTKACPKKLEHMFENIVAGQLPGSALGKTLKKVYAKEGKQARPAPAENTAPLSLPLSPPVVKKKKP